MTLRQALMVWVPPLLLGLATLLGAALGVQGYADRLRSWQMSAMQAPEGTATADLFAAAVKAGALRWNPGTHRIDHDRLIAMPGAGPDGRFDRSELGVVIMAEVARANGLSDYLALSLRRPGCADPCEVTDDWTLLAGSRGETQARRLALGAAAAPPGSAPPPSLPLHWRLHRDSGPGFRPWQAWRVVGGPVEVQLDDPGADRVDVIGAVDEVGPGWAVTAHWCRNAQRDLVTCDGSKDVAAVRLDRKQPGEVLRAWLRAVPVLGATLPDGRYPLTDRIFLVCQDTQCVPHWQANAVQRRLSPPTPVPSGTAADEGTPPVPLPAVPLALDPWADPGSPPRPSDMAETAGAMAVVEDLIPAAGLLSEAEGGRLTLDPVIQPLAQEGLDDLLDPEGSFADLAADWPDRGPRISLVVIDLRAGPDRGAIRAAVGVPAPPVGLGDWTRSAAAYDPEQGYAAGPVAWTGRGAQHTPGSTWKMLTALALIDMATDPALPLDVRLAQQRTLDGLTADEADVVLGPDVLTGQGGLCLPRQDSGQMTGAPDGGCPAGWFEAIADSGAGGPLRAAPDFRYGLSVALSRSSNIWFSAAFVAAERARLAAMPPAAATETEPAIGDGLAAFAARLGLLSPQALDGNRGLAVTPRDAADLEGLRQDNDLRSRASVAFGQRVQAGPLVLAQLAGAIRTGDDIRPALLAPVPTAGPLFQRPDAARYLDVLRGGMRDVVSGVAVGPGGQLGTAAGTFAIYADTLRGSGRVGGKTGTGQLQNTGRDRVSTFAGWLDGPDRAPWLAFGCASNPLGKKQKNTDELDVPQVCAALVADLMRRVDGAGAGPP